ncbi:hypothetical protein HYH03_000845 [Edaphochlamys debaryana]|uniref:Uncharacterized protein n=1 Tax=Edaphochlamys debaryana TaxID=47281 RepID=A0A836C5L7_9CHLO|nr:hypothetical protein HYH03_000845 [Edaphochlamys debaryana]|eukprot:KAG2501025.1 hypothetical protein HYH03_000845 [Edaphochlamys debaryana]
MPAPGAAPVKRSEISTNGIAERVRWLPSTPPGPADLDGRVTNHALVIWGEQDSQEDNFLVVHDLVVTSRGSHVLRVEDDVVTAWHHRGRMTDLTVCEQGGGQVTALFGTTEGAVHVLRLVVPRTPGAGPKELQLLEAPPAWRVASGGAGAGAGEGDDEDGEEGGAGGGGGGGGGGSEHVAAWLRPHRGAVAAVDMQLDTKAILTAGQDGALFVLDMEHVTAAVASASAAGGDAGDGDTMMVDGMEGAGAGAAGGVPPGVAPYRAGNGCVGHTSARWVDRSLIVTSRTVGGLELWDIRCPPTPVSRSKPEWGATGLGPADRGCHRVIHCLQVHPSRPDVCASGGSGGAVALWDLRAASRPLALTELDAAAGPVWEVRFDTREGTQYGSDAPTGGAQAPLPAVLFCTEDGALCRASASGEAALGGGSSRMEEVAWRGSSGGGIGMGASRRGVSTLAQLPVAINSFDVGGPFGSDVVAVTGRQTLLYMQV